MKKLTLLVVGILLLSTVAFAQTQSVHDLLSMLKIGKGKAINEKIPEQFRSILGSYVWQGYIPMRDGTTQYVWFETKNGQVVDAGRGHLLYPTPNAKIEASQAVIENILQSSDKPAAVMSAIKNNEIKIQYLNTVTNIFARISFGAISLFGSSNPPKVLPVTITDSTGTATSCNVKWDGPKEITCSGTLQAPGTGYGQNCCEQACGADAACDEQAPGSGSCSAACKAAGAQPPSRFTPPSFTGRDQALDLNYPEKKVCEFYQTTKPDYPVKATKKLVTCSIPSLAKAFCVTAMGGSPSAVAERCDEQGMIVCSVPCSSPLYVQPITHCAFDINRPRGTNAAPLSFCKPVVNTVPQSQKKAVGATCNHGGECMTGNCVGVGMGPPWTYQCSCNPFRMEYNC